MHLLWRRQNWYQAVAAAVFFTYLFVVICIPLMHRDDCPLTANRNAPTSDSCPACKFIAGAHSAQVSADSGPSITTLIAIFDTVPDSSIVPSRQWIGSIIERGPPSPILA